MAKKTNCVIRGVPKFRLRAEINGVQKNFYGESEKHAIQLRDEYIERNKEKSGESFEVRFENWLEVVHKPSLAPSSYNAYESTWRVHLRDQAFVTKDFLDVDSMDLQIALNSIKSNYRKARAYMLLTTFYKYCLRQPNRKIFQSPLETVTIPKVTKTDDDKLFLTKSEMAKFMKAFENDFDLFLYVFSAHTGLRQGETFALTVSDVDFTNNAISVTKSVKYVKIDGKMQNFTKAPKTNKGIRKIPINSAIIEPLKKQIKYVKSQHLKIGVRYDPKTALLFPNTFLAPQRSTHVLDRWKRIQKKLDIFSEEVSFHMLRHTFCSMLCVAGVPLRTAADLMGHSGIDMVSSIYAHTDMEYMRQAIDKIGDYYKNENSV
jgi:integrase